MDAADGVGSDVGENVAVVVGHVGRSELWGKILAARNSDRRCELKSACESSQRSPALRSHAMGAALPRSLADRCSRALEFYASPNRPVARMDLRDELEAALGELYSIETELGGGGMSRVFLAEETALERRVVVKVLPRELTGGVNVDRFRREIVLAAQLQHPHIVTLLSTGQVGGVPYYTMPYEEGRSLRAHLRERGPLPIGETVGILGDVAKALAFAHERGVIHRDIKPDNILLCGGAAVVSDFGIAKAVSDSKDAPPPTVTGESLTQIGMSIGTPTYMAPEQAAADPDVDFRADIYAFGVTAYEMLAGRPPFCDLSPRKLLAAHLSAAARADPRPTPRHAARARRPRDALPGEGAGRSSADGERVGARARDRAGGGGARARRRGARRPRASDWRSASSRSSRSRSWHAPRSSRWGFPSGCSPLMLVATVLVIVVLVGRAQGIARAVTPLTPARRGE